MLSNDKMIVAMGAARDQVLAICHAHEREAHGDEACMANRASAIAYLAHCLGVRNDAWQYAEELLQEYDERCEDATCKHNPERRA